MAEHSPTPWIVGPEEGDPAGPIGVYRLLTAADGSLVGHLWPHSNSLTDGNADLLTRAVNNHEKLVDIVKDLMVMLDPDGAVTPSVRDFHLSAVKTYLSLLEDA